MSEEGHASHFVGYNMSNYNLIHNIKLKDCGMIDRIKGYSTGKGIVRPLRHIAPIPKYQATRGLKTHLCRENTRSIPLFEWLTY